MSALAFESSTDDKFVHQLVRIGEAYSISKLMILTAQYHKLPPDSRETGYDLHGNGPDSLKAHLNLLLLDLFDRWWAKE